MGTGLFNSNSLHQILRLWLFSPLSRADSLVFHAQHRQQFECLLTESWLTQILIMRSKCRILNLTNLAGPFELSASLWMCIQDSGYESASSDQKSTESQADVPSRDDHHWKCPMDVTKYQSQVGRFWHNLAYTKHTRLLQVCGQRVLPGCAWLFYPRQSIEKSEVDFYFCLWQRSRVWSVDTLLFCSVLHVMQNKADIE